MVMLYFSGTGNSEYIARKFSDKCKAACYSIEEEIDFEEILQADSEIGFCYPIYGSCVPKIMRDFVARYRAALKGKKVIIFCTQMLFSGDGAKALYRLLPVDDITVLYAEHFSMPNNISNFWLFPIGEKERVRKLKGVQKRLCIASAHINNGIVRLRGWGSFSKLLGKIQNVSWPAIEEYKAGSFTANHLCNGCGLCAKICPAQNLEMQNGRVLQKGSCILCCRCMNRCPQKAVSVLFKAVPKKQYKGPTRSSAIK